MFTFVRSIYKPLTINLIELRKLYYYPNVQNNLSFKYNNSNHHKIPILIKFDKPTDTFLSLEYW